MNNSQIRRGFVTTFNGFIDQPDPLSGLDASGAPNRTIMVTGARDVAASMGGERPVIHFPVFPNMTDPDGGAEESTAKLLAGLREYGDPEPILMFTPGQKPHGTDAEQEAYLKTLTNGFVWAHKNGFQDILATAFEQWMSGAERFTDREMPDAHQRLATLISAARQSAIEAGGAPERFHLEKLRPGNDGGPGEFSSYTDAKRAIEGIEIINGTVGGDIPFCRFLHDFAHSGDSRSTISVETQTKWMMRAAEQGLVNRVHASARTHRGCLVDDLEWTAFCIDRVAKMNAAAYRKNDARIRGVEAVNGEVFHWKDELLKPLRVENIGFGKDTFRGRTSTEVTIDNLALVAKLLNAQVLSGALPATA